MTVILLKKPFSSVRTFGFTVLCFLISFFSMAQSKNYQFEHISTEDGLSQNFINMIIQDHRGFMWFGTNDGLNRYDGNQFKAYYHHLSDSTTLQGNSVTVLFEDSQQNLWVGAGGGINCYDRLYDRFERVLRPKDFPGNSTEDKILDIIEDHNGDLWIAIENAGLYHLKLSDSSNEFKKGAYRISGPYHFTKKLDQSDIYPPIKKLLSINNNLWVSYEMGISKLETSKDGRFSTPDDAVFTKPLSFLASENYFYGALFADDKNTLWIGTSNGLIQLPNPEKAADFQSFDYPDGWFAEKWMGSPKNIIVDSTGQLWFSTYYGVVIFNPSNGLFKHILHNNKAPNSLSYNGTTKIYINEGKVIWIGTGGMGLNKYASQVKPFRHYLSYQETKSHHSVFGILEDKKGDLWITINGGRLKRFGRTSLTATLEPKGQFLDDLVSTNIVSDQEGNFWLIKGNSLVRFDPISQQTDLFPYLNKATNISLQNELAVVLYLDQEDQLWGCNYQTLFRFFPSTETFQQYKLPVQDLGQINAFLKDRKGLFWLATRNGLLKFNINTGESRLYQAKYGQQDGLKDNLLKSLLLDPISPDRFLWIGTGSGLHRLDMEKEIFQVYTKENGLPNNYIYGILSDDSGKLWISTNNGLSCFDPASGEFNNFKVEDGLQSNEFNTYAFYKSERGELFFGGINGLTAFFPEEIKTNPHIPPVVLTDMQLSYESVQHDTEDSPLSYAITESKKINLNYDQHMIAFEFAALDFTSPENNQYRYYLEGFDKDWVDAGVEHRATYTNLPPGNYTFHVQGANNDGLFNKDGVAIQVIVSHPPWRTWWAYSIYFAMICLTGYGVYLYFSEKRRIQNEISRKEEEANRLKEIDRLKARFFANIAHEFRTPITLIKGHMDELLEELKRNNLRKKVLSVKYNADQLLQLIKQLLDIGRLESNKMNLNISTGDIVSFTKQLVNSLQPNAKHRNINLDFHTDQEQLMTEFDPDALQKILQNLISNALKFTAPYGKVSVNLTKSIIQNQVHPEKTEERVLIKVIDEGIGIPEKDLPFIFDRYYQADNNPEVKRGFGLGLDLARELVTLFGGTIHVKSELNKGTKFTVEFPFLPIKENTVNTLSKSKLKNQSFEPEMIKFSNSLPADINTNNLWAKLTTKTILVVEDNGELNNFIKEILQPGFRVIQAKDGQQGLNIALDLLPDMIISDIMMPNMDGFEMIRRLLNDQRTSHIPIILLSAKVELEDRLKGLDIGAIDYLVKPFHKAELIAKVRNITDKQEKLKMKYKKLLFINNGLDKVETTEQLFLKKVKNYIEGNLDNEELKVEQLAGEVGMSPSNLYRKLLAITELSPVQLIQRIRLDKAAHLLKNGHNVSEVTYIVGFKSPSYFSQAFKKHYGCTPRDYSKAV